MYKFENMDDMVKRLYGSSSCEQAKAVVKAIKLINNASGMLDKSNRAAALYHLTVALVGHSEGIYDELVDAAELLDSRYDEDDDDEEIRIIVSKATS